MRTIPCPICERPVSLSDPEMPFCSERCRLLDLGNWASEKYVFSTPIDPTAARAESPDSDEEHDPAE